MQVVIVGAEECGGRAAFALREAGFDGKITILGSELQLLYERPPMSQNYTSEQKPFRASGANGTLVFKCDAGGELAAVAGNWIGNDLAKDLRVLEKLVEHRDRVFPAMISDPSVPLKSLLRTA
jgi:hypothetical protein